MAIAKMSLYCILLKSQLLESQKLGFSKFFLYQKGWGEWSEFFSNQILSHNNNASVTLWVIQLSTKFKLLFSNINYCRDFRAIKQTNFRTASRNTWTRGRVGHFSRKLLSQKSSIIDVRQRPKYSGSCDPS